MTRYNTFCGSEKGRGVEEDDKTKRMAGKRGRIRSSVDIKWGF